jgi:hypothetical protein
VRWEKTPLFRRLLERLFEQQFLAIDADKELAVRNCSVTDYAVLRHRLRASTSNTRLPDYA